MSTTPAVNALRGYTTADQRLITNARIRGLFEGAMIVVVAAAGALLIARAPVQDVEVSAQLAREANAMKTPPPCWHELPMGTPITQQNIDRLCIKVQSDKPATKR